MSKFVLQIRIILKRLLDRIRNERFRRNLLQAIPFWVASVLTGLMAIFYAQIFAKAEDMMFKVFHYHAWLLFLISPVCFILAWWIVRKFAPFSRGSGIPQIMASVELANPKNNEKINKMLSIKVMIVKFLSSIILVIGGGVVGREGPTIQIAGSIFRKINEFLPSWWPKVSKKNMIMTGAAAGLAAAFNTPLGGIVFAVEELTKMHLNNFKAAIFTGVIVSGLIVQSWMGTYLYLGYPIVTNLSQYILLWVIAIAIIAGLMGSSMSRLMWSIFKWKKKFKKISHHLFFLLACSLIITSIGFFVNENMLGSGKSLMTSYLFSQEKYSVWYMSIIRSLGSLLSFTTGAAGGVFAPGLCSGASVGATIAGWVHASTSDTNLMILTGMVAFLTGITRAPFTSATLVLEMTDRNNLILHLMLAGIVANFVSAVVIDRYSLYDHLKHQYIEEIFEEEQAAIPKKQVAGQSA